MQKAKGPAFNAREVEGKKTVDKILPANFLSKVLLDFLISVVARLSASL